MPNDTTGVEDAADPGTVKNVGGLNIGGVFIQKFVVVDPATLDPWDHDNPFPTEEV